MIRTLYSLVFVLCSLCAISAQAKNALDTQPNMFSDIEKYAQFSSVAYDGQASMQQVSKQWGYVLSDAGQLEGLEVRYLIATNPKQKTQIISVRGTARSEEHTSEPQ